MIIEYPYIGRYLFNALEAGPIVVDQLIRGMSTEEADLRPDPDRFTIREVIAHLADWEPIFLGRMRRICEEDMPVMENRDEGQLAIDNNYAALDPFEQAARFRAGRAEMIAFLNGRKSSDWSRAGNRPEIGILTLEACAFLATIHDGYHTKQIAEWRQSYARRGG